MVSGPLWASGDVGFRRRAMECVHGVDWSRQRTRHVARCAILVWRRRGRRVPRIGSRHLRLAAATNARYRERNLIFWRAGGRSRSISVFPMALRGARLAHGFFSSRRSGGRLGVLLVVLVQRFSK